MANILAVAGPNSKYKLPNAVPAGFWAGLWHGIIAPIVFIVSLFDTRVRVYEIYNKGRRYDFGFLIGVGAYASHSEAQQAVRGVQTTI
jgi:hypothetical protein